MKQLLLFAIGISLLPFLSSCCLDNGDKNAVPILRLISGQLEKVEYLGTGRFSSPNQSYSEMDLALNPADSICSYRVFYQERNNTVLSDTITVKYDYRIGYGEINSSCDPGLFRELKIEILYSTFSEAWIRKGEYDNRYYVEVIP